MKKWLTAALAGVTALSLLAGCAGGEPSQSSTGGSQSQSSSQSGSAPAEELKMEYWFLGSGPERTQTYQDATNQANEAIREQYNSTVEAIFIPLESAGEKFNTAVAAQATPDLGTLNLTYMASIFAQDAVYSLEERFAAWDESDQFMPEVLEVIRSTDMDGELKVIPQGMYSDVIWYRTDLFADAGVEPPTSWENFFSAAEALTKTDENGNKSYGITVRGGGGSITGAVLSGIIAYAGEEQFFDEAGNCVLLRSPAAEEYVQKIADLCLNGYAPESSITASMKEMVADFDSGVSAMIHHNLGSYENHIGVLTEEQFAAVPLPTAVNGKVTTAPYSAKGLCIFKNAKNPDAAWAFIQNFCTADLLAEFNMAVGELPPRYDSMENEAVTSAPHLQYMLPYYSNPDKVVVNLPNYLPDYNTITKTQSEALFQEVLTGNRTAASFLDELATLFEVAEKEYRENVG